jgi:hypothetical protein
MEAVVRAALYLYKGFIENLNDQIDAQTFLPRSAGAKGSLSMFLVGDRSRESRDDVESRVEKLGRFRDSALDRDQN